MIDLKTLWVGDWIIIKSSGIKGQFDRMDDHGNVVIRGKDLNKIIVSPADAESIPDETDPLAETILNPVGEKINAPAPEDDFGDTIDLHYESLTQIFPHLSGSKLEYQIDICTRFIKAAIQSRLPNIQIIHGRGQGILKNEVERLLKQHHEITIISSNPNLASVDAWLNYH